MPIYDYTCGACSHLVEVIHGIHDPGPRFCPACGAEGKMRKEFATPAVHFKGSGWAKKDRGGSGASSRPAAKSGESAPGDAGAGGSGGSSADAGAGSGEASAGSGASGASGGSGGTPGSGAQRAATSTAGEVG